MPGGDLLLSELRGGWVDQVRSDGSVVWATHVPGVKLPSDPQRLADGTFLTVDYQTPGKVVRFTSSGKVLWSFGAASGVDEVSNPSLAAPLPNGLIAVCDDFADRVFLVDPATDRIVWSYGHRGVAGTASGYLNTPDGFDLLLPDGTAPLHVDFATATTTPGRP
jgi:outer membrane protein assembly factor BamB